MNRLLAYQPPASYHGPVPPGSAPRDAQGWDLMSTRRPRGPGVGCATRLGDGEHPDRKGVRVRRAVSAAAAGSATTFRRWKRSRHRVLGHDQRDNARARSPFERARHELAGDRPSIAGSSAKPSGTRRLAPLRCQPDLEHAESRPAMTSRALAAPNGDRRSRRPPSSGLPGAASEDDRSGAPV
jgi:hypothetical protein